MRIEELPARAAGQQRAIVAQVPWADGFGGGREDLGDPLPGLTARTRRARSSGTTDTCS